MIQAKDATNDELCDAVLRSYYLNLIVSERQIYESERQYFTQLQPKFLHSIKYTRQEYAPLKKQDKITMKPELFNLILNMKWYFDKAEKQEKKND
jgi:hypothetical protein